MRVDSDGNIGVGINAPSSMLHLFDGGTDTGITLQSKVQANATSSITFMSRKADNSNVNAVLKNIDGRLQSSAGIMFGSDTAAENALDDYEEGTFTPNIRYLGSGTDATTSQSSGVYTKIGRVVYLTGMLKVSNTNSGTGHAALSGFPFTVADSVANTSIEGNGVIGYFASFSSNVNTPTVTPIGGTTYAELYTGNAGTTASAATHTHISTNAQLRFSVYFIV